MHNLIEADWMQAAACLAEVPEDTRFIRPPVDEIEEEEWGRICAKCPVFRECLLYADREKVTGVFVVGEYRE